MKAVTNAENKTATSYAGICGSTSSASRINKARKDVENEEIQVYLSKLKELVPFMPKNRKLSKLEVIQNVIDYICDLQYALDTHPTIDSAAVQTAAAVMLCSNMHQPDEESSTNLSSSVHLHNQHQHLHQRQPLATLPPNSNDQASSNSIVSSSTDDKNDS